MMTNSEKLSKNSQENIDFQEYLLQKQHTIPRGYFTDRLFESEWLNNLFIRVNKILILLMYNLINATMQSHDTVIRRRMFQAYQTEQKFKTNGADIESTEDCVKSQIEKEKPHLEKPELCFPKRTPRVLITVIVLQLLYWIHYLWALYVLNDPTNKKYGITCSKKLETYQTLVKIIEEPFRLSPSQPLAATRGQGVQMSACFSQLETHISDRYDKFFIWNMSVTYMSDLVNSHILLEQSFALQMFSEEVKIFCHTIGTYVVTSGIVSGILSEYNPYNVAPMVFVFDPLYCAHHIKSRIRYYLYIIRMSYANFWTIHHLDLKRNFGKTSSLKINKSNANQTYRMPDSLEAGSHELSFKRSRNKPGDLKLAACHCEMAIERFDHYIPSARSCSLRKIFMIFSPTFMLTMVIGTSIIFASMYIFFVSSNDYSATLNRELRIFLEDGHEPDGFSEVLTESCLSSTSSSSAYDTHQQLSKFVRRRLIEYLASALHDLNPDMSMLNWNPHDLEVQQELLGFANRSFALTGWSIDVHDNLFIDEDNDISALKRVVVNSIEPIKTPTLVNWLVPLIGGIMVGLILPCYLIIFFSIICDLCFWLFEIRIKLDICNNLLTRYEAYGKIHDQEPIDSRTPDGYDSASTALSPISSRSRLSWSSLSLVLSGEQPLEQQQQSTVNRCHSPPLFYQTERSSRPTRINTGLNSLQKPFSASSQRFDLPHSRLIDEQKLSCEERDQLNAAVSSNLNLGAWQVIRYILSSRARRQNMCSSYAYKIVQSDARLSDQYTLGHFRRSAESFLLSAYLDFRLFIEQIDDCRFFINLMIGYTVLHALDVIASSHFTTSLRSKIGFTAFGYLLANCTLFGSSFFQSQCTKLISPIHSFLAASSASVDKPIKHIRLLWQRALTDISGSRSKFSFRVYSVNISYAAVLQFNLGVTSLYILTLDKMRHHL